MHYDPTITLGNLLTILGMLVAALGLYVRIAERLTRLETQMSMLLERRGHQRAG